LDRGSTSRQYRRGPKSDSGIKIEFVIYLFIFLSGPTYQDLCRTETILTHHKPEKAKNSIGLTSPARFSLCMYPCTTGNLLLGHLSLIVPPPADMPATYGFCYGLNPVTVAEATENTDHYSILLKSPQQSDVLDSNSQNTFYVRTIGKKPNVEGGDRFSKLSNLRHRRNQPFAHF
jgi:hypothetical protein